MTNERILELLEIEKRCLLRDCDRDCAKCDLVQDRDELEEMYTLAYCIIQDCTPEPPIRIDDLFEGATLEYCPSCKKRIGPTKNYCSNCGKAIDWGSERMSDAEVVAREIGQVKNE